MAVTLLQVGDHMSLEMDIHDLEAVKAHIASVFPDVTSEPAGIATRVKFAGTEFTFQNEWDDPCLISGSAAGDAVLRAICQHFNQS